MKKILSVLLSLALCLGMLPVTASAATKVENPELDVSKGRILLVEDRNGDKLYAQVYKDDFTTGDGGDSWTPYTGRMTITGNNNSVGYASIEVRGGEHNIVLRSVTLNATLQEKENGFPGLNIAGTGAKVNLTLEGNNMIRGSGRYSNEETSQPGILVGTGSSLTIGGSGTLRAVGGNTKRTTTGSADDGISVIGSLTIQDGVTVTAVGGNEGVTTGASQGDGILIGTGASLVVDNSHLVLNGKRPLQVGSGTLTLRGPSSTLKASMPYAWEASIPCNLEPGSPEYYGVLNGNTKINAGSATLNFKSSCSFAFSNRKYSLTVQDGGSGSSGGGSYIPGTPVSVSAGTKDGYAFHEWKKVSGSGSFADPLQAQTTFTTDMGDAVISPVFWPLHTLTVTNGTASKTRGVTGETVTLQLGDIPEGQAFARWEIVNGAGKLSDPRSPNSSFTFGDGDAQIQAVLVAGMVFGDFVVATEETEGYTYGNGVLTISGDGAYTIRMRTPGTTTGDRIFLDGGRPTVILDGVQIHNGSESAIQLAYDKTTNATLILSGENKLSTGGTGKAAIAAWTQNPRYYKANLTITSLAGDGSTEGRLEATGSNGIGHSGTQFSGAITINGGTIVATGNGAQRNCGFGIGRDGNYSGAVTINGGDVTAIGTGGEKRAFGKNPVLNNDPSIQVNEAFAHRVNSGSDQNVHVYYDSQGGSSVKSVAVTPQEGEVLPGSTLQFTAQVEGGGNATKSVTWSVDGGVAGTSIDANGLLTVAQDEMAQTLIVKATNDYSGISADASVTVTKEPPEVSQWPTAGEITYGQALSEAVLTGGTANTPGSFVWTDGIQKPAAGTGSFEVTFQPEDTTIPAVTGQVSVTVRPAAPFLTWSSGEQTVSYTGNPAVIVPPNVALVNDETYQGDIAYSYTVGDSGDYASGLPVDVGEYWVKASVPAQGNYTAAQSGEMKLTIEKDASPAAPTLGEGYELDYIREIITVKPGYEVRTAETDGAAVNGSISEYLGGTLYIRKVEDSNHAASGWTAFQLASRPAAPSLTKTDEALKGQKNGSISGVNAGMEYSMDGGDTWNTCPGTEITGLEACTVLVRVKATEAAPYGEAASCMILEGKLITVTFDSKGGSSVQQQTGFSYGSKAAKPADPVREYYAFQGWYKDAECTTPWDFASDALTEENVTLYAKWKQVYFSVTVKVTDDKGQAYNNAVVTLKRGSEVIDTTTKGTDGAYAFAKHVEAGIYNVVVTYANNQTEQTKTALITVSTDQEVLVELPEPGVNSHLDVSADADTPAVMVGGLDQEAAALKQAEAGAGTVTVSMEIEGKKESLVEALVVEAIKVKVIGGSSAEPVVEYLDITVNKQVGSGEKMQVDETKSVMEIVVPFNFEGRNDIVVVRYHGDAAEKLTQTNDLYGTDGTYREDRANGYIHIFTQKFSTYAVGYTTSYTVTFDAADGTVSPATGTTRSNGTLDSLPTPVRDGHTFKGWYTSAQGGTAVSIDTVFTGNTIIYAHWEKNSTSGGGSGGGGGWVSYYSVKVSDSAHGKVTSDRASMYSSGTVTLTVQPDEGYMLDKIIVTDSQNKVVALTEKNGKYTFKMPGGNVTVMASFVPIQAPSSSPEPTSSPSPMPSDSPSPTTSPSPSPKPWKNPFPDVSNAEWYIKAVEFVCKNGLMGGYANGKFGPNDSITRAQFAQIIYNKEGRPQAGSGVFNDVTTGWYAGAVNWAAAKGIVKGVGGGRFAPNHPITRQDLAVMLWRYAGSPEPRKNELDFSDAGKVSAYAWKALCWANESGIVSGKGNGILDPKGKATRAEAAQMLMNYLK